MRLPSTTSSLETSHLRRPGETPLYYIKLLWLAIRDIEDKRARARAAEKGAPRNSRKAPARLIEGAVTQGWRPALAALLIAFPDRLEQHIR